MQGVRWLVSATLVWVGAGCDGPVHGAEDAQPDPAVADAAPAPDSVVDAQPSPDALMDAAVPPDAPPPADAAPPNADPCAACVATSECVVATCTDGVCGDEPVADGTPCAAGVEICVVGGCVTRGCGDGYREPGPDPAREGCDDGNVADGDACAASCTPAPVTVGARWGESDEPTGAPAPAVGVDGEGRVLVVWKQRGVANDSVVARRLTRIGVPLDELDDPILIDGSLWPGRESSPTVVGLASGWVVVWTSITIDGDSDGIAYRQVTPEGTMGTIKKANQVTFDQQHQPSVSRLGTGFVVVWTDEGPAIGSRVVARRFTSAGNPDGDEIAVSPAGARHNDGVVAATDSGFLVAWSARDDGKVIGRRFAADGTAVDALAFTISALAGDGTALSSIRPAATVLDTGDYAVAWTARSPDFRGDIAARVVAASGTATPGAVTVLASEADVTETRPSVAALGGAGFVVLYHRASFADFIDDVMLAVVDGVLAPEEAEASALLATMFGDESNGSVVRAPDGLWLTWEMEPGELGADRSVAAYLLPLN